MKWITGAKHLENFEIQITFNDQKVAIIDFKNLLRGDIFAPLKDLNYFKKFRVDPDIGGIIWPNGADLRPNFFIKSLKAGKSSDTFIKANAKIYTKYEKTTVREQR